MKIGYARVSTAEQNLDLQLDALQGAGCQRIYEEHASGKHAELKPISLRNSRDGSD
jgi:DNA invertase Pin-like site-specific DNA recombinase